MRKASAASQGRNFVEAIQRTTKALEWAPLKWQLYFSRALGKVGAKQPVSDALDDFRRARFLEPNAFEVPYEEGIVWLATEPSLALDGVAGSVAARWRAATRDVWAHAFARLSTQSNGASRARGNRHGPSRSGAGLISRAARARVS